MDGESEPFSPTPPNEPNLLQLRIIDPATENLAASRSIAAARSAVHGHAFGEQPRDSAARGVGGGGGYAEEEQEGDDEEEEDDEDMSFLTDIDPSQGAIDTSVPFDKRFIVLESLLGVVLVNAIMSVVASWDDFAVCSYPIHLYLVVSFAVVLFTRVVNFINVALNERADRQQQRQSQSAQSSRTSSSSRNAGMRPAVLQGINVLMWFVFGVTSVGNVPISFFFSVARARARCMIVCELFRERVCVL